MPKAAGERFDRAYYERFYLSADTRVIDKPAVERLGGFVCSYLRYMEIDVQRVLDVGCGIGLWKAVVRKHFRAAEYQGVEYSEYLCKRYGWQQGSVIDYRAGQAFDLVICQGVLPYLSNVDAGAAVTNLAKLCRGALYLEAVTREDWEGGVCDKRRTDSSMHWRTAAWYRRQLRPHFRSVGGGVWLSRRVACPMYALEQG